MGKKKKGKAKEGGNKRKAAAAAALAAAKKIKRARGATPGRRVALRLAPRRPPLALGG